MYVEEWDTLQQPLIILLRSPDQTTEYLVQTSLPLCDTIRTPPACTRTGEPDRPGFTTWVRAQCGKFY